jgi:uncharacterized protein with FMN-binding domain
MKKLLTSIIFLIVFVGYGLYRFFGDSNVMVYVAPVSAPTTQSTNVGTEFPTGTTLQSTSQSATATTIQPVSVPVSQTANQAQAQAPSLVVASTPKPVATPAPVTAPVVAPTPVVVPTPVVAPAPVVVQKPQGQYVDGTYTGSVADAYYGNVQVQVKVSGGQMTDVAFLQYPNDRSNSRYINSQAMPILKTEAIQSQNAQVDTVSGASDTSQAFRESLASALSQAKS